ncbi:YceI family protein [Vibrio aphrogenes]|uniref:YceI family protein n=1 Tax=Vibrio aphrogenes TaxID=1891186 RepID=UPI000B35F809|nr:YceI family protein [Vibrio aphrogenes]
MKTIIPSQWLRHVIPVMLPAACTVFSQPSLAAWHLDPKLSQVHFITVKNSTIAEVNQFKTITGIINDQGAAVVDIDLASVDTKVDIRDQRIKEKLFNVLHYPEASLSAQIDMKPLQQMKLGEQKIVPLNAVLSLHDQQQSIQTHVSVVAIEDGSFSINTLEPILINADLFGMSDGIKALQNIANLEVISPIIPVTAQFVFQAE